MANEVTNFYISCIFTILGTIFYCQFLLVLGLKLYVLAIW